jgi:1-aminocyclopropane-1-carboxylate deaminase/D-cysteine desulfhydrase-like pyridoxal-dependent ACC family enzyme
MKVHAVAVCDTPDEFYEAVQSIALRMGLTCSDEDVRGWLKVYQGQGLGYSISSEEELRFLYKFSCQTGITLDPVYSGKAMYTLCNHLIYAMPDEFRSGQKILFIHTGGTMGAYAKAEQLLHVIDTDELMRVETFC